MTNKEDISEIQKFKTSFCQRDSVQKAIQRLQDLNSCSQQEIDEIIGILKKIHIENIGLMSQYVKVFHDVIPRLIDPNHSTVSIPNPPNLYRIESMDNAP